MHNSFRLNFCTIGVVTFLTIHACTLQQNLDNANLELKTTTKHLQEVQSQLNNNEQELQKLRHRLNTKNSEIVIMSVCLEGVGRALSNMGNDNRSGAFLELSSVIRQCRQADNIAEKTRIEQSQSASVEAHTSVKNVNQWTSDKLK
ncbi:hypothetical protein [Brasilonema sp. UFV-L1]|uniref:hypothetical protein n=1 Tax=Brasilonema sp. UFV-L1 TaxID=2234130 RepID=UPI00145D84C2|nr:hypothetical protein [Brasilonema sp. UFV-L1]NMG06873.1 hypothetical protein [Brasilonema sp. UFV-L1]